MHEQLGKVRDGFTDCPASLLTSVEHGERLTLPGTDERVHCIACKRIVSRYDHGLRAKLMELPPAIQAVVLELISFDTTLDETMVGPYRVYDIDRPAKINNPPTDYDFQRMEMAAACCNADTLAEEAERVVIKFSLSTVKRGKDNIKLSYLPAAVAKMSNQLVPADYAGFKHVVNGGDPESPPFYPNFEAVLGSDFIPPERAKALRGLLRLGFKPLVLDTGTMPRIMLRNTVSDKIYEDGVTVEFTWDSYLS